MRITAFDTEYEVDPEATAGQSIAEGSRWWGTRIRFRPVTETLGGGTGRWRTLLLVDVHPMDEETIRTTFPAALALVDAESRR